MKRASRVLEIAVSSTLVLVLSPLLIGAWLFRLPYGWILASAWSKKHGRVGRRFLVVYSNSPKWAAFFSEEVVPQLQGQAVVVDISKNPSWKSSRSLERKAHLHWGGRVEHTPIVIHFGNAWRVDTVRFYEAFQQMQRGDSSEVGSRLAKVLELARAVERA
jgi:hypothetical protein